ncbi:MAG TPA: enolase C-terminal domain-like protein, partial [Clostridia bacterium]|nr:enolase C-terminal domain-like protein [Clostridia bacterium]
CHIGSNLEWEIGTAAMCHLACACPNVHAQRYPVDILGPLYYSVRPRDQVRFQGGRVTVPEGPGLGLSISADEIEALALQSACERVEQVRA